jgi:predicted nucleic acid-binding protein
MNRCYCDANIFLGWFNREEDKVNACRGIVEASEKGELQIITSALTLTEVIKMKGQNRLPAKSEEQIRQFFEQDYVRIMNVDRPTAELARQLIWEHTQLDPKDSIHVATAIQHRISPFHTFDKTLLKLDGQLGRPPLRICTPDIPDQLSLLAPGQ